MTVVHFLSRSCLTLPEELQRLVRDDVQILAMKDYSGRLPVYSALMRGNVALTSYLLEFGTSTGTDSRSSPSGMLLHYASLSRRTEAMDLVLRYSKDIHVTDSRGRSILHAAVLADNPKAIQKVFDMSGGGLLHCADHCGETVLSLAPQVGAWSVVAHLKSVGFTCPSSVSPTLKRSSQAAASFEQRSWQLSTSSIRSGPRFSARVLALCFLLVTFTLLLVGGRRSSHESRTKILY